MRKSYRSSAIVISVGNISLGGTGKSVVVRYLASRFSATQTAIILRGYGAGCRDNLMVRDPKNILAGADLSGDEAAMIAASWGGFVVVGRQRAQACQLLERHTNGYIRTVILDDAYQHHSLIKNVELLLLDARHPFENKHCLPAGRLREKNINRADAIILTHANAISLNELSLLKRQLSNDFNFKGFIFTGRHSIDGVFLNNLVRFDRPELLTVMPFAGVGSWEGFLISVGQSGLRIVAPQEFVDHHDYTLSDLESLVREARDRGCNGLVTTEKDWVKIKPMLSAVPLYDTVFWYVLRVKFSFLSDQEQSSFDQFLKSKITT